MSVKNSIVVAKSAEEIICGTCSELTMMIKTFMIYPEDWPAMNQESPEICKRIEEIEWYGPRTIEDTQADMHALLKNYERLFARRSLRRKKSA